MLRSEFAAFVRKCSKLFSLSFVECTVKGKREMWGRGSGFYLSTFCPLE